MKCVTPEERITWSINIYTKGNECVDQIDDNGCIGVSESRERVNPNKWRVVIPNKKGGVINPNSKLGVHKNIQIKIK
jgi:hypothetical protein